MEGPQEESFSTKLHELAKIRLTIHHQLLNTRHHNSDDIAAWSEPVHEALEQWIHSWESLTGPPPGYSATGFEDCSKSANLLYGRYNCLQATFELFTLLRARSGTVIDQDASTSASLIESFNKLYESGRDSPSIPRGHEKSMIPPPTPFIGWTQEETIFKAITCLSFRKHHEVPDTELRLTLTRLLHDHNHAKLFMGEMFQSLNNDTPRFSPTDTEDG